MKSEITCLKCGSGQITAPERGEWRAPFVFAAIKPKKCADCGHIWEPPAPAWLLWLGIVVGLVFLALAALMATSEKIVLYRIVIAGIIGGLSIAGCVRRLRAPPPPVNNPEKPERKT